jgi:hypothetical protein
MDGGAVIPDREHEESSAGLPDRSAAAAARGRPPGAGAARRRMVRSELLGNHTHTTSSRIAVNISLRDGKYLARGRLNGQAFGETLGADRIKAERRLHELLVELENAPTNDQAILAIA